ncbi:FAD-binding oxidoreductase [Rhodobacteraceae bacterium KMM 6894]|nr:FAD-binding oxidoreductase [Rhodobacteraceae bacterium KMM 6894]
MTQYRAARLPHHLGPAAWSAILGPMAIGAPLDGNRTADFVIIGAGFAGLSAARRLTQLHPGARIVVLDAGRVAEGAAGRNSGFMIDLPHDLQSDDYASNAGDQKLIALNRTAIAFAGAAVQDYDIDGNYFRRDGKVNGAASAAAEARNVSYARHLETLGEPCEILDARAMQAMTGSAHYRSGLYSPGTVMLQPAGYIRGLAAGLRSRDVDIFEQTPATQFARTGTDWDVSTPRGTITTPRIILTVNGHLESFGFERGRLMQLFLYAVMSAELDKDALRSLGGQSRWGITPSDPMGTTVRRIDNAQGGNRIIVRTCATLRPNTRPVARDLARASKTMRAKFDQRFPQIAGLPMEHAWAGHLCLSRGGVSVTRQLDQGVWSGCVQNGLGTARGTLTGIAAAEMAAGTSSSVSEHFQGESRPKRLPPRPFQQIGANAVLRFREWTAREE